MLWQGLALTQPHNTSKKALAAQHDVCMVEKDMDAIGAAHGGNNIAILHPKTESPIAKSYDNQKTLLHGGKGTC